MKQRAWLNQLSKRKPKRLKPCSLLKFFESRGVVWGEEAVATASTFVSDDGYDLCAICKAKTSFKTETPLDQRSDYVEGVGQLCDMCSDDRYPD